MSNELPSRLLQLHSRGSRITIVASTYNEKFTNALVDNCTSELDEAAPYAQVEVVRVPGAFEIPVMVKRLLSVSPDIRPDAVIALGVIIRGSTAHADLIGTAVTQQLLSMSCESLTPIIHEVLLLDNEEQAFARCIAAALNRGRESARTALRMCEVVEEQNIRARAHERKLSIDPRGSLLS